MRSNKMKRPLLIVAMVAAVGSALAFTATRTDDEVVALKDVPAAVRKTIEQNLKGGKVEKIERSTEGGKVVYEVEAESTDGDFEFLVGGDGAFLGTEHEEADHEDADHDNADEDADGDGETVTVIKFDEAPKVVRDSFAHNAAGAKASRVEKIVDEEVIKYEIEFEARGGTTSLTLASTGDLIEREFPVAADALPEAVRREIAKDYPGATIKAAEAVELHYFEMDVEVNGKVVEVQAFATGDIEDNIGGGGEHADEDHEPNGDHEADEDHDGEGPEDDD